MEDDSLDREGAKKKILVVTNSNKKINTNNDFLKKYSKNQPKLI